MSDRNEQEFLFYYISKGEEKKLTFILYLEAEGEAKASKGGVCPPEGRQCGGEHAREIASLVRKQWKSTYVEVSAKYNWRVVTAFRYAVHWFYVDFSFQDHVMYIHIHIYFGLLVKLSRSHSLL